MENLVVTIIARDQPGLVESIAQCVATHGGNWLDSRMSRMAGQFAGILRIAVPETSLQVLVLALQDLQRQGIRVQVANSTAEIARDTREVLLRLIGNDRPGIVRDITRLLVEEGINLDELDTWVAPAPMSNELLFHAEARLAVPAELSLPNLREHLETLADELMVELQVPAD
ncbi:glycine cleavage system protein R [Azomonas macrocytogenes]|uniref:Glycine cleavage system transcriptional repressor n=1 Tax=Azomonas macrocytogenes TaxID=69962 RepID=A0A839T175_AZOMA|nr:ACT domain-containing protein [Azomonas macrocytogenes]MBB3102729.1 glycine cleavage system regulatory protein [Azomonas macrocytogenes]